jgi:hypothetical protein
MVISGSGQVGIGTMTLSDAQLEVFAKTAGGAPPLYLRRTDNGDSASTKLKTGTTDDWIIGMRNDSTSNLRIYSYGTSTDVFSILRADGKVGIGTTAPAAELDVQHSSEARFRVRRGSIYTELAQNSSGGVITFDKANGDAGIQLSSYGNSFLIGGNVGIGTATPGENLHIFSTAASTTLEIRSGEGGSTTGVSELYFSSKDEYGGNTHQSYIKSTIDGGSSVSSTKMTFHNRNAAGTVTEHMMIGSEGKVGIGTTAPGYNLEVAGTFYSAGSSVAYKENVEDLEVDPSLIHSLRAVSYDYKKKYKDFGYNVKDGKQMGLISEEVAETIPELAIMKDGKPKNVDYQKLAVVLLAEVQNLKKEIEELKNN